ncbi:TPA: hypothetical protein ACKOMF_000463 [Clostridioides difficile]|nr:hypothetical protein [Clostridioides difficile]
MPKPPACFLKIEQRRYCIMNNTDVYADTITRVVVNGVLIDE